MDGQVRVALQLLGAITGLTALATLAGGAVTWVRFDAMDMPADQVVNLLPKQLLLITGLHTIVLPVVIAIAGVLLLLALTDEDQRGASFWIVFGLLCALLLAGALIDLPWPPWDAPVGWAVMLAVLALGAVAIAGAVGARRSAPLAYTLIAVFAIVGATSSVVRTAETPKLEPVALLVRGRPSSFAGFYIGQTSDRVYIAPLPGSGAADDPFAGDAIDRVAEIRRDDVLALVLAEPAGLDDDEAGRGQAQDLLADLRSATEELQAGGEPVTTANPIETFAPLVNLHSQEPAMPMSAEAFIANSWLVWAQTRRGADCRLWVHGFHDSDGRIADLDDALDLLGRFDVNRLAGDDAYTHRRAGEGCKEEPGAPAIRADDHTRPYDVKDRPEGLSTREGFALDLRDDARTPAAKVHRVGPQLVLSGVPIYVERQPDSAYGTAERITYWFFYGLSQPPGPAGVTRHLVHEGDWERISVLVRRADAAEGGDGSWVPISVRFHTHDEDRDVPWAAVRKTAADPGGEPTHPVAYSAKGSHATYWAADRFPSWPRVAGKQVRGPIYDVAFSCASCPQWKTWQSIVDARSQPWYGFGGAWGQVGGMGGTTGPLGPSRWKIRDPNNSPTSTVRPAVMPSGVQASTK